MIDLQFSISCLKCPYIDVMHNITNVAYEDDKPFSTDGYISCKHKDVCKLYDHDSEIMDIIKKQWIFLQYTKTDND